MGARSTSKSRQARIATLPAVLLGSSLFVLGSCELLGLDHYRITQCHRQSDCEQINVARNIGADACQRFQCVADPEQNQEQTCRLRPRDSDGDGDPDVACMGTDCDDHDPLRSVKVIDPLTGALVNRVETCDGADNDCNGIVDEGPGLFVTDQSTMISVPLPVPDGVRAASTRSGQISLLAAAATSGSPRLVHVNPPDASGMDTSTAVPLTLRTQANTSQPFTPPSDYAIDTMSQCFTEHAATSPGPQSCEFGESAAAEVDAALDQWILLTVDTSSGCAAGILRAGTFAQTTTGPVDQFGPARRTPIALGIGVTTWPTHDPASITDPCPLPQFGTCTGDATMRSQRGASRPNVVPFGPASGSLRPQALAAWSGRPGAVHGCTVPDAPVEAMVLWPDSGLPAQWTWVNGSGTGIPATLGNGRGDAAPAIIAISDPPGFVVAFAASAGGIALRFVNAIDTGAVATLNAGAIATYDHCPDVARPTPDLQVHDLGVLFDSAGSIESVAISARRTGTGPIDVALAYQTGCATDAATRAFFARARLDLAAMTAVALGDDVALSSSAGAAPVLQYIPTGLLQAGSTWHGHSIDSSNAGGWWVSWVDGQSGASGSGSVVQRFSEIDGTPVDSDPVAVPIRGTQSSNAVFLVPGAPSDRAALAAMVVGGRGGWQIRGACRR